MRRKNLSFQRIWQCHSLESPCTQYGMPPQFSTSPCYLAWLLAQNFLQIESVFLEVTLPSSSTYHEVPPPKPVFHPEFSRPAARGGRYCFGTWLKPSQCPQVSAPLHETSPFRRFWPSTFASRTHSPSLLHSAPGSLEPGSELQRNPAWHRSAAVQGTLFLLRQLSVCKSLLRVSAWQLKCSEDFPRHLRELLLFSCSRLSKL
mmetsp:Transcript_4448/g.8665  ORF Transcript_4448/g.8665 Transcript_4448/m.8665 type:complete len:203 (+) Transcript_4448:610-1218(+)